MSIWLKALKKISSFLGIIKDTGLLNSNSSHLPDISSAISSGLLIGPTSYALKSNPKYLGALPTNAWESEDIESPTSQTAETQPLISQNEFPFGSRTGSGSTSGSQTLPA